MSVHDNLVAQLITELKGGNYQEIRADLHGYDQPNKIWWKNKPNEKFIPDVTAKKDGILHIYEVETSDAIGSEHADAQWKLFAASATKNNGHFWIYVEDGAEQEAKQRVQVLGIDATVC